MVSVYATPIEPGSCAVPAARFAKPLSRGTRGRFSCAGARVDRRGPVRFADAYGQHLCELYWEAGADQGSPSNPDNRFVASETLVGAATALPVRP